MKKQHIFPTIEQPVLENLVKEKHGYGDLTEEEREGFDDYISDFYESYKLSIVAQRDADETILKRDYISKKRHYEIVGEIKDYLTKSRKKLKDKRVKQASIKPDDIIGQVILGAKAKAIQQVIDKVTEISRRE